MNIEYQARHFDLDDDIREYAADKLAKAMKFLEEPIEARVTLEVEKHRKIAELRVTHRFGVLTATEETAAMLDSINVAADKIEKQARRARQKHKDRRRRADRQNGNRWPVEVLEKDSVSPTSAPRVIKTSHLEIRHMSLDEAATKLEHGNSDFVVFRDSTSDEVNVLYKRRDDNYGLISPGV